MQEELITLGTARLAKEKGFTLGTVGSHVYNYYQDDGDVGCISWGHLYLDSPARVPLSLLYKWLREVHKIDIMIMPWEDENTGVVTYQYFVLPNHGEEKYDDSYILEKNYDTYEESLEQGLQEALKLI